MSLLSDLQGLKGENLSTAVLAHLLLRSPAVRDAFIHRVSELSLCRTIYTRNHFAVFREQNASVTDEEGGRLRLDLVIETDDTVIGIENKFYAPFHDGQPGHYLPHLENTGEVLGKLRCHEFNSILIVLAPRVRAEYVGQQLSEQGLDKKVSMLAWEDLINDISKLSGLPSEDAFLVRELTEFVKENLGQDFDLKKTLPFLQKRWEDHGSSIHREFLNRFVWAFLDDSVKKDSGCYSPSSSRDYYGWYLIPNPEKRDQSVWIGFMEDQDAPGKAGLFIGVNPPGQYKDICNSNQPFQPVESNQRDKYGNGWVYFRIPFESTEAWQEIETWSKALWHLNQLLKSIGSNSQPQ